MAALDGDVNQIGHFGDRRPNESGRAQRLRAVRPGVDVLACAVYVATEMAGPGHRLHQGRGERALESGPRGAEIAQALAAAGIPTEARA
ncbi:MAG: hypothetical protein OHK0048_10000 [Rhodoferax sp.]